MKTYVALFRGINVGGKNILPMNELVALLEGLGLSHVQTYIQSGNAIFRAQTAEPNDLARIIGDAVNKSHSFAPKVLVLSFQDFHHAIDANPFPAGESQPKSLHLFFLKTTAANPDEKKLATLCKTSEKYQLAGRVFYLYTPEGFGPSKLAANVEKALGVAVTARNWRSAKAILSLAEKAEEK